MIKFSQKSTTKWNAKKFEEIWNNCVKSNISQNSIGYLYNTVKKENYEEFLRIIHTTAYSEARNIIYENAGLISDDAAAKILYTVYQTQFIYDIDQNSYKTKGIWYEFITPDDNIKSYSSNSLYKWKQAGDTSLKLKIIITTKLVDIFSNAYKVILTNIKSDLTEEQKKYYKTIGSCSRSQVQKLQSNTGCNNIIAMCGKYFVRYGFIEKLDKEPDYIGVANGVLNLETMELIQRMHEIPISRYTSANCRIINNTIVKNKEKYLPITEDSYNQMITDIINELENCENENVKHLFTNIKNIFADEYDAFIKIMLYFSSSLDGHQKQPIFMIFLGEGQNGKTFLLEMHTKTLGSVSGMGYANSLSTKFLARDHNSGSTDTELMSIEYSRCAYFSESDPGMEIKVAKIKNLTGNESISGNEKYGKQKLINPCSIYIFCSNYDPKIKGRDWGTIRRILSYRFKVKFTNNPDPNNKYEKKEDTKFIEKYVKDPLYNEAYLSIMIYFYNIYRNIFNSNINKVPSISMQNDTLEYIKNQDTLTKFIHDKIIFINNILINAINDEEIPIKPINLTDIIKLYQEWLHKYYGNNKKDEYNIEDLRKQIVEFKTIKNYFKIVSGEYILEKHIILKDNEYCYKQEKNIILDNIKNYKSINSDIIVETKIPEPDFEVIDDL